MSVENDPTSPLVAIVTPVYNGGKYLRQTMECVQAQTYPNIVHVLLNNCSTDDTAEIIASFKDTRIPVLSFENESVLPLAANWNKAFSHVPEDAVYAKLLCADDLVRADAIERFVAVANSDPKIEVILSQDVFADRVHRARLPQNQTVYDGREIVRQIMLGRIGWLAFHHFFVRIHPDYRNGNFIDNYWSPDPHVVVRSSLRGKFAYLHEPLVYNRLHADSVTGKELNKKGIQFLLVHMHLLRRFGRDAFAGEASGERNYRRSVNAFVGRCCRQVMRWGMTGQKERARELANTLRDSGYEISAWTYLRHFICWPINSIQWRRMEIPPGSQVLDESAFMSLGLHKVGDAKP